MLEVTYTLGKPDYAAFMRYHRWHAPSSRLGLKIVAALFAVISAYHAFSATNSSPGHKALLFIFMFASALVAGGAMMWAVHMILEFKYCRDAARSVHMGEQMVALTPDGMRVETGASSSMIQWRGIHRIVSAPKHIFIYPQVEMAFIVPRRAFTSVNAADEFLHVAQQFIDGASSDPGQQDEQ